MYIERGKDRKRETYVKKRGGSCHVGELQEIDKQVQNSSRIKIFRTQEGAINIVAIINGAETRRQFYHTVNIFTDMRQFIRSHLLLLARPTKVTNPAIHQSDIFKYFQYHSAP